MLRSHLTSRAIQVSILGAMVTLCSAPQTSQADKAKIDKVGRACVTSFKTAVQVELAGHLREAKDHYLACAKPACGALVRNQCSAHVTQLETDIPSVVPLVTNEAGHNCIEAQVTIDKEPLTSRVDGRALVVDPGPHEFSVVSAGEIVARRNVMILQGQRNRPILLALNQDARGKKAPTCTPETGLEPKTGVEPKTAVEATAPFQPTMEKPDVDKTEPQRSAAEKIASESDEQSSRGPGVAPYLLGSVGLVGLGTWGLLTYWGRRDNDGLSACAPTCSQASVNHVRNLYLAADVSLGVGAAALGTSLFLFVSNPSSKEKPPSQASYRFDVQPTLSGGFASVSGTF